MPPTTPAGLWSTRLTCTVIALIAYWLSDQYAPGTRSDEHTPHLQPPGNLVCRSLSIHTCGTVTSTGTGTAAVAPSAVASICVEPSSRPPRSEEHTSELQSPCNLVCRLLLEKKKKPSTSSHNHRYIV